MTTKGSVYLCDVCGAEAHRGGYNDFTDVPDGWEAVSSYDVCGKCCKIMRAFANKEV